MKKLFAILLAVTMLASMATVASAAENTTTLTTTVPAATYTLNIPADQEIIFGATETNIGSVSVTNTSGFAEGKNLNITLSYDAFSSEQVSTKIPFSISMKGYEVDSNSTTTKAVSSDNSISFLGTKDGTTNEFYQVTERSTVYGLQTFEMKDTLVKVSSEDWGKALAGEYTATITFTAEVVVE